MSIAVGVTEVNGFGTMPDGTPVELYTVRDGQAEATFTNYGARLVSLTAPDAVGQYADVVEGYDSLELYLADKTFQGAVVGRVGNRIAGGRFSLEGKSYQIPKNNGENALHGGPVGFGQKVWAASLLENGVEFALTSPDGDQGFPGTLTVVVRYTFTGGALRLEYEAASDAPTVVNVTNHAYFNLSGEETILGHSIMIPAERYTPVTAHLVPTGELALVAGTPFDFREATEIGLRIEDENEQLARAKGYDHNWVFGEPGTMKLAARLTAAGRVMTVETTEPGVQFYSGNFIDGTMPNRNGGKYKFRSGLCLETQHYPDSPNHPEFPSTTLLPGETMRSTTVYTFSAEGGAPRPSC